MTKPFSNRIIVWTEIPSMSRQSFGLIVICDSTKRTLLVQMKDSPEFLHFIRGFFRKSDVPVILSNCTEEEHSLIRELCDCDQNNRRIILERILKSRFPDDYVNKYIDNSLKRITEDLQSIKDGLLSILPQDDHFWLWPKGGINKDETSIECAIRETKEESGISISEDQILLKYGSQIIDSVSFFGSVFKTCYYIAMVDAEIESKSFDTREISKVEWVNIEDIKKEKRRMSNGYRKLIEEVEKLIKEKHPVQCS